MRTGWLWRNTIYFCNPGPNEVITLPLSCRQCWQLKCFSAFFMPISEQEYRPATNPPHQFRKLHAQLIKKARFIIYEKGLSIYKMLWKRCYNMIFSLHDKGHHAPQLSTCSCWALCAFGLNQKINKSLNASVPHFLNLESKIKKEIWKKCKWWARSSFSHHLPFSASIF